jgi:hypothetical protein
MNVFRLAHNHFAAVGGLYGDQRLSAGVSVFGFLLEPGAANDPLASASVIFHNDFQSCVGAGLPHFAWVARDHRLERME